MGISNQLKTADEGFAKIAKVLADKPVVIGENDPEGCAACPGPQNAYRNGTMYSSYTVLRASQINAEVLRGVSTENGTVSMETRLPLHGVALIDLSDQTPTTSKSQRHTASHPHR